MALNHLSNFIKKAGGKENGKKTKLRSALSFQEKNWKFFSSFSSQARVMPRA
jgi:hypothetical protein